MYYKVSLEIWQKDKNLPGWVPALVEADSKNEAVDKLKKLTLQQHHNIEIKGFVIDEVSDEEYLRKTKENYNKIFEESEQ